MMMRPCVSECNLKNTGVIVSLPKMGKSTHSRNPFRGVRKEELQRRTQLYLANMTVSFQLNWCVR